MKNWQGIATTRLTLGGEVMVPRDNSTLEFITELLNYIIGSLSKLTRRPRGGGHIQISIQLKSE